MNLLWSLSNTIFVFLEKVMPAGDWSVVCRDWVDCERDGYVCSGVIVRHDIVMSVIFQRLPPLSPHSSERKGVWNH